MYEYIIVVSSPYSLFFPFLSAISKLASFYY
jgi:hypothetical protein